MGQHALTGRRLGRLGLLVLLLSSAGCGEGSEARPEAEGEARSSRAVQTTREERPPRPRIYDHEGSLLPGDVVVAGLPLPEGFEIEQERPRVTVLRGRVPVDKALAYFGPRLITGRVEQIGAGARYIDAVPVGVQGGVVRVDVSILPRSSGGTRVEVRERLPPGAAPVPDPSRQAPPEHRGEQF